MPPPEVSPPSPQTPSPTLHPNRYPPLPLPESPNPRTIHPFQISRPSPAITLRQALFSPSRSPRYIWKAFRIVSPHSARKWIIRLSAWIIVLFRLATAMLNASAFSYGGMATSIAFGTIFGAVGLWIVAGCLAVVINEGVEGGNGGVSFVLPFFYLFYDE
jgi:hypothetical protein